MTEINGHVTQKGDSWLSMAVLRAVPCAKHPEFVGHCPDCLTGEEAAARGRGRVEDLGVVATSWEGTVHHGG